MGSGGLSALLSSRYVLFSCEGTAEAVVVARLVESGALAFPKERVVDDPLFFTPFTRLRKADDIADRFFRTSYEADGARGLLVCRVVDSRAGRFAEFPPPLLTG